MKKKLFSSAVILIIFLSGCGSVSNRPVPQQQGYEVTGRQVDVIPGATSDSDTGITVLDVKKSVKTGEKGSLSIKGVPDTIYTISAYYNNSLGTTTATNIKRSGNDGKVSWDWDVKRDTLPGTYKLIVTGGGKMITSSYTVTQ